MIDIVVRGTPAPQSRPRVTVNGVYSNAGKALKAWRAAVQSAAYGARIEDGALSCAIVIGIPVKDRRRHGKLHSARPDFDNLAKAIVDALQPTARITDLPLVDDGRIASAWIVKIYAPSGFARIMMDRTDTIGQACEFLNEAARVVAELEN